MHRITWDGADTAGQSVSPGVYRVRARAGGQEVSKALVRVR
jgi:flagellar hook assembly protein FlgD